MKIHTKICINLYCCVLPYNNIYSYEKQQQNSNMPMKKNDKQLHASGPAPTYEPPSVVRTRHMLNRWSMFGLLAVSAVSIILFVSNALTVNKLVVEIEVLHKQHEKVLHRNEVLRATIIRLQAADRIADIARTKLGMIQAQGAPKKLKQ